MPADRPAASDWYRKAAEQGDPRYSLGVMLERGEGIDVDKAESAKWYQKAAEAGHIAAQNNLGAAYYLGEGVPCLQCLDEVTKTGTFLSIVGR